LTLSGIEIANTFNLTIASYDNVSFSVSNQDSSSTGIAFSDDGTKMYMIGRDSGDVYQYSLTEPFDISTASYDSVFYSFTSEIGIPEGLVFNGDGTKLFVCDRDSASIYQCSLTTSFDISTLSYDSISFDISGQETSPYDVEFSNDGTKMYVCGNSSAQVHQYTLTSGFDLNTASYDSVSLGLSDLEDFPSPRGLEFNNEGTTLYVLDKSSDSIGEYVLGTDFDISTATFDNNDFNTLSSQDGESEDIVFSPDGTKLYLLGRSTDSIYQYSTGEIFNYFPTSTNHTAVTSASINTEFWADINSMTADDVANDGAVYYAVSTDDRTTWKIIDDTEGERAIVRNNGGTWEVNDASDYGTETWVAASENDEFYALEEAVETSTASFSVGFGDADTWSYDSVSFDVSNQDGQPRGIEFNDDGTKLYMIGNGSDSVYQYTLSTAFDLSTASYDSISFDASSQDTSVSDIRFNNDGSKMYIVGESSVSVHQYSLSTAFDLSTASYDSVSFSLSGQDTVPFGIAFNSDGTKMYMVGAVGDSVYEYVLSTAFDLSSASYNNISFSVSAQESLPSGVTFNTDGTKMYIVGLSNDSIHQYSLITAFDLSTASYDNLSFSVAGQDGDPTGITFNNQGTKVYMTGYGTDSVYQYTSAQFFSTNRMDATQLDAVSDANHFTLGDDLDLAITLFMADGNTDSPTSDGVAINYDANVVNQGAVLGTDYEWDKPTNDTVRITALSDENFKVRVV